ncbi:hypothetical protein ACVWZZ_007288 [Bradyrhizobium sp. LM6.10]
MIDHGQINPYHEVAEHEAGQQQIDDMSEAADRFAQALATQFLQKQRHEADHGVDQRKAAKDAGAEREAGAKADDQDRARRRLRIFFGEADQTQHQDDHGHREGRILRIHEHVAVEDRAECEQQERGKSRKGATDAAAEPPRHRKPDHADDGADQTARLEQLERNHLVQESRDHVEAAAIHVEVGEGECRGVLETGTEHAQQQVGIFSVGVVVPAEPVVAEGQACNDGDRSQHQHGEIVASPFNRAPQRRFDRRSRDGCHGYW